MSIAISAPKPSKFVRTIDRLINASDKTQRQIALDLGYDKPNLITMFKQGTTRIPVEKVPYLADTLEVDRVDLLRMWFEEYDPKTWAVIQENMGMALSAKERSWVTNARKFFKNGMPPWDEMVEQALKPLSEKVHD